MLLTPQFGVRQICMSIVTDAPLTADPLYHGAPLCRDCDRCVAACPVQAIGNCTGPKSILTLDGKAFTLASFRHNHCDWAKRYSLVGDEGPKYTTSQTNVMPPEEITAENLAEALKQTDEIQKDYFLVMEPCFIACPGGRR
jgi:epoxyqueuosine reductase QueG